MEFLDDIIEKINTEDDSKDTKQKTSDEKEQTEVKETPKDGLLTYTDEFYKQFKK